MTFKHYANLSVGQTHFRRSGSGKPLVLLHASPMSSELMLPLISTFDGLFDVIAPDTPGYGQSDRLPPEILEQSDDLTPYVEWLSDFISTLGHEKICLYGTATGAQIAIEFARRYPNKLDLLILENAAHFTDQERQDIMSEYFPDISPQDDGKHLELVWSMAQGLFKWFPWYKQDTLHQISSHDVPASTVHSIAMAYLIAGENYDQAYRRAFMNEDARRIQTIEVPVRIVRWQASILKKYTDRMDDLEWPEHIQMRHAGPLLEDRYRVIKDILIKDY